METKDIIIIGGGAAGLMASCAAAHVLKKRGSVLVLEGNAKLGRKLLATGSSAAATNSTFRPRITTAMLRQFKTYCMNTRPKLFVPCSAKWGLSPSRTARAGYTRRISRQRPYSPLCGGMPKNTACHFRKNTPSQKSRKSKTDLRLSVRTARSFSQSSAF